MVNLPFKRANRGITTPVRLYEEIINEFSSGLSSVQAGKQWDNYAYPPVRGDNPRVLQVDYLPYRRANRGTTALVRLYEEIINEFSSGLSSVQAGKPWYNRACPPIRGDNLRFSS